MHLADKKTLYVSLNLQYHPENMALYQLEAGVGWSTAQLCSFVRRLQVRDLPARACAVDTRPTF